MTRPIQAAIVLATLVASGCIKRTETIAVYPDGSVDLLTVIDGDPDDVTGGDATPSPLAGWQVTDRVDTDDEGKETLERTGRLRLRPGQSCPPSYAAPGSEREPHALWFPTMITVERRREGTYYHFHRVYQSRTWARIERWRKQTIGRDEIKKIGEKKPEEVTDEDRAMIAEALVGFEAAKNADFFDQAVENLDQPLPQDAWLVARRAVLQNYDTPAVRAETVALMQSDDAGEKVEALEHKLREQVLHDVQNVLRQRAVPDVIVRRLIEGYDLTRASFEVTEDLGDENWMVVVVLPGRIVGHNAQVEPGEEDPDSNVVDLEEWQSKPDRDLAPLAHDLADLHFEHGFSVVSWTFDGKDLYDEDVVLMASSFVPNG